VIQPRGAASARTLRLLLWSLLATQIVAGAVAVILANGGHGPLLGPHAERAVAYAWVAVTIAAAVGAYGLAGRGAARADGLGFGRAFAAAGLADLAAFAGILAFYVVKVWPMLAVAALAALLGIAISYPRSEIRGEEDAVGDDPAPGDVSIRH